MSIVIDELVEYLKTAPTRLAVFGEFSAGKTTVLNALIGEEILSVAVEPTTAVPTRVCYGREFNIFIERVDDEPLVLFEDDPPFWTRFVGRRDTLSTLQKQQGTIRDFLRTWTKEGERADEVERVVIELPMDWLKGGLELVDTPGVNNEFARHHGFTEQEAGAADIALLLMDARQGGGKRTEFEFMNEVQGQVERCLVAPNKMDLVPRDEREEFLDYIRETALPKHWKGAITPPVLGISALAALHPEEHEEPGLVSAFEDLRVRLETMAEEERGKLLLARRGNPEKKLFGRAKELEGEDFYGRAHRVYFDLLDVLEAADLDPTPAEEGIARCEEHLSKQVDALDTLNERYNEAIALADEDPDGALERLEVIRDEKEDLRLEDGDLHASIEQLRSRIEERDAARQEIQQIKAQVEQHRHNENWIEAAKVAQEIRPLIDTAELSEERAATLRQFVKAQEQDRDEWAEERWMAVKARADSCVDVERYSDAKKYLDPLKVVAPYTSFEAETADFVNEVTEKAELETEYQEAVRNALEEAQVLRHNRVDPEEGKAAESAIEEIEEPYRTLYGVPDLPERPPVETSGLPLTIAQKLGLARQLKVLSEHSSQEQATDLLSHIRERKSMIDVVDLEGGGTSIQTKLLEEYPDHPVVESTLNRLIEQSVWFWKPPWEISQMQRALDSYEQEINPEKYKERRLQLENTRGRATDFYGAAVILVLMITSFLVSSVVNPYLESRSQYHSLSEESQYEQVATAYNLYHNSISYGDDVQKWAREKPLIPFSILKKSGLSSGEIVDEVQRWNQKKARQALKNGDLGSIHRHLSFAGISTQDFADARLPRLVEAGEFQKALDFGSQVFESPQHIVEAAARGCIEGDVCLGFAREAKSFLGDSKGTGFDVAQELIDSAPKAAAMLAAEYSDTSSTGDKSTHPFWAVAKEKLLKASEDGRVEVVQALLLAGVDADVRGEGRAPAVGRGPTPLMLAASRGHLEVARLLLESGADPSKVRGEGGETPLTAAAGNNHTEIISLLVENGADPNRSTGVASSTPLISAVRNRQKDAVRILLQLGATPTSEGIDTPREIANREGFDKILRLLESNVTMFGGSATRTGVYEGDGPDLPISVSWRYEAGVVTSSPVALGGNVFVGSNFVGESSGNVYAIDSETGNVRWRFGVKNVGFSSPSVAGESLYVGGSRGDIYALNVRTGQEQWRFNTEGGVESSPAVYQGVVFVGSNDGNVYALDAKTGKEKWQFETDSGVESSPAVYQGVVFVGSNDGNVYALSAETGRQKWSFEADGWIQSSPAIEDKTLFVGKRNHMRGGSLFALDIETGYKEWEVETDGWITTSPAVKEETVYVGSDAGRLYAFDAETGHQKWMLPKNSAVKSPAVSEENIYIVTEEGNVCSVYTDNGRHKWCFEVKSLLSSSPILHDGRVYFGSNSEGIYSLN